jgi:hypothetical protein
LRIVGCSSRRLLVAVQLSVLRTWRLTHTEKIATKATIDASTTSDRAKPLRRMGSSGIAVEIAQGSPRRNDAHRCPEVRWASHGDTVLPGRRDLPEQRASRSMSARPTPPPGSGLHQCRLCHDDYVVPVWWEEVDDQQWHMLLRCAQCDTYLDVVVNNDVAEAYERDLQRGMAEIAATLDRSDRARMVDEVQIFIAALERDLIDATDFSPR